MDWSVGTVELLGALLSAGGWLCSLCTTMMPFWLTLSTDLLPTESLEVGLWKTCVIQDMGLQECQPYNSLLGLPPDIKLARILMCAALGFGLLGSVLAVLGLNLINSCCRKVDDRSFKKVLKTAGGTLSLAAGILVLVPVSYIAHLTVVRFFDESVPDVVPRWEFGDSLFCGWTAGVLHLVAGTLLLISSLYLQEQNRNLSVHIPLVPVSQRQRSVRISTEYI
ncbi:putative claudin-24 [Gambusia affinis]|uniref:putative claudin-24 n=1 Tax=Gambusia affinis TaxID=33528 RepID=UPI001CDB8037|nr:putative claudin-24 [Gambusia affinis]